MPDLGEHAIAYALVPHDAEWTEGDMMRVGEDFNVPLVVVSSDFHSSDLAPVQSLVSVAPKNVRLTALKRPEEGRGLILRLIEVGGRPTEATVTLAAELVLGAPVATVLDTLERSGKHETLRLVEGVLTLDLPAFGIRTIRVDL